MKGRWLIALTLIFLTGGVFIPPALSGGVPKMTKDELNSLLGNPELMILDVRRNSHWASSDLKIKGAVREEPNEIQSWADKYPKDKTIVLYCA
jgi:hypothetical protein